MRTAALFLGALHLIMASIYGHFSPYISQVPSIAMIARKRSCQYKFLYLTAMLILQ